jgi:hypothetical protein
MTDWLDVMAVTGDCDENSVVDKKIRDMRSVNPRLKRETWGTQQVDRDERCKT